jgi:hypothetical protein
MGIILTDNNSPDLEELVHSKEPLYIINRNGNIRICKLSEIKRGLTKERVWKSATNGRGPWWNAGQSHMNEAYPKSYFEKSGLVSLYNKIVMCH